jgi:hypothetical protein
MPVCGWPDGKPGALVTGDSAVGEADGFGAD